MKKSIVLIVLVCMALFCVGILIADALQTIEKATLLKLTYLTIGLSLGFLLSLWIKPIKLLRLPLLFGIAFFGGMMVLLWEQPVSYAALGMLLLAAHFGIVVVLAKWQVFRLERIALILGLLALIFSLAGGLLVFAQALPFLILIWAGAACVCFSGLLYNAMVRTFQLSQEQQKTEIQINHAASIFLLNMGLLANVVIVLGVLL